jgi:hypothetical protein
MHLDTRKNFVLLSLLFLALAALPASAQKKEKPVVPGKPVIWADPGAVEKLDFTGGPGGRNRAPKPPFTFVEENLAGTNPKVKVTDANGVKWNVKFGSEVNAETFATRIVWACGYFVDPAYFVPSGKIQGVTGLGRAKKAISSDGSFSDARFELPREKGIRKLDEDQSWGWETNSFVGGKEINGLKVLMMLTSNWDNKDVRDVKRGSNTAIYQTPTENGMEDRYIVTDWGGSMGKWGGVLSREKWDCSGYAGQTKSFVKGVKGDLVEFGYSGQHSTSFKDDIRKSDVQWVLQYLGRITDQQLRDGLQASGATAEEVPCFTAAIRDRINQLKSIR